MAIPTDLRFTEEDVENLTRLAAQFAFRAARAPKLEIAEREERDANYLVGLAVKVEAALLEQQDAR